MKLATREGNRWIEEQGFRWFRLRKRLYQWWKFRPHEPKQVLFVAGCQRSGTSMIHHLFRKDWNAVTYDEISPLSSRDAVEGLRWNSIEESKGRIMGDRAPFVVAKPLVESQNLPDILDAFPGSRAIWMYRDFRAVAISNVDYFGPQTGHRDLAPILVDDARDWRSELMDPGDRETIRSLYEETLSPHDAAALFWFARNSLYFSRGLDRDHRIMPCRYRNLVTRPAEVMKDAYRFAGRPYPGDRILRDVHASSRDRGLGLDLSGPIEDLCRVMLARLDGEEGIGDGAPSA